MCHKSWIWIYTLPLRLQQPKCLLHGHFVLCHEEGGDKGGGAGLAVVAVDQHGPRLLATRHEADHGGEVAQQILTGNITNLARIRKNEFSIIRCILGILEYIYNILNM